LNALKDIPYNKHNVRIQRYKNFVRRKDDPYPEEDIVDQGGHIEVYKETKIVSKCDDETPMAFITVTKDYDAALQTKLKKSKFSPKTYITQLNFGIKNGCGSVKINGQRIKIWEGRLYVIDLGDDKCNIYIHQCDPGDIPDFLEEIDALI